MLNFKLDSSLKLKIRYSELRIQILNLYFITQHSTLIIQQMAPLHLQCCGVIKQVIQHSTFKIPVVNISSIVIQAIPKHVEALVEEVKNIPEWMNDPKPLLKILNMVVI